MEHISIKPLRPIILQFSRSALELQNATFVYIYMIGLSKALDSTVEHVKMPRKALKEYAMSDIEVNIKTTNTDYCVYSHTTNKFDIDKPEVILGRELFYIGVCKLRDIVNCPDAHRNSMWKHITRIYHRITVTLLFTGDETSAIMFAQMMIDMKRPACNINSTNQSPGMRRGKPVKCLTNGKEYLNAKDAAEHNSIAVSTMSNHLLGRKGYKRIRGLEFKRINKNG